MRDSRDMMIDRQAEIISNLNDQLRTIHGKHEIAMQKLINEISAIRPYANFYKKLQETILDNPTLSEEWQRFCLLLKMTDPDIDKYQQW